MKKTFLLLAIIYGLTLILNDGFMATDEYWTGITRYIPAQKSSVHSLVREDDVKSPLQILPLHLLAQTALKAGLENPYLQYRFVIAGAGVIQFLLLLLAFHLYCQHRQYSLKHRKWVFLILGFYFAAPFALTRPMFESMAAPWLALSAVFALRYEKSSRTSDLLKGVATVSVAFVLRQQLGLCALTFILWPVVKRNWKDFAWASGLGLFFFLLSGIPDIFLRGDFHYSLKNLFFYNVEHGSDYGSKPITFYPLTLIAMTFAPFLVARYPKGFVKETLSEQKSLWLFVFFFVFLHSLFPNKWERFLISLIPILIFMVEPFLYELHQQFRKRRIRLILLYSLNGILFFVASFFPPQKNLISMSIFLNSNPQIEEIYRLDQIPEWITDAFITDIHYRFVDLPKENLSQIDWSDCKKALVLGKADSDSFEASKHGLRLIAVFPVNFIEKLAYRLNPKSNVRRTELHLYSCPENPSAASQ